MKNCSWTENPNELVEDYRDWPFMNLESISKRKTFTTHSKSLGNFWDDSLELPSKKLIAAEFIKSLLEETIGEKSFKNYSDKIVNDITIKVKVHHEKILDFDDSLTLENNPEPIDNFFCMLSELKAKFKELNKSIHECPTETELILTKFHIEELETELKSATNNQEKEAIHTELVRKQTLLQGLRTKNVMSLVENRTKGINTLNPRSCQSSTCDKGSSVLSLLSRLSQKENLVSDLENLALSLFKIKSNN